MNDGKRPPKPPVDWDDLFPGRFLKAGQLGDRKPTLTIKSIHLEDLPSDDGSEKRKGVITFREIPYEIALNKTNGLCLKAMFGREVATYVGRRVTLFKGEWKGEPAVRIWGSPDIPQDITIPIKFPRRGVQHVTLRRTEAKGAQRGDVAPHPTEGKAEQPSGGEEPPPFGP
jgi:hypothetical protein